MIPISRKTLWAIKLILTLRATDVDVPRTLPNIIKDLYTKKLPVSESYAEQILHQLHEAGLVATRRGPGGGYYLLQRITLLAVVKAIEQDQPLSGYADVEAAFNDRCNEIVLAAPKKL